MTTKTILIAIIILATNHIKSQDFSENFLGNDFLNYKNVYLKINDAVNEGFSTCFYDELKEATSISSYKILYVDSTYASQSVKDSLINRIFLVKDILDKRSGKPIIGAYYNEKAIFVLEDTLNKQQIFFIYNTKVKRNFPFLVSEIKIDTDKVCSEIERTQDDFNGNIKLNSSIFSNITIYKEISKKGTFYYLRLRTKGSTVIVDGIGAIILFTVLSNTFVTFLIFLSILLSFNLALISKSFSCLLTSSSISFSNKSHALSSLKVTA